MVSSVTPIGSLLLALLFMVLLATPAAILTLDL
jgi:hypothetical protein